MIPSPIVIDNKWGRKWKMRMRKMCVFQETFSIWDNTESENRFWHQSRGVKECHNAEFITLGFHNVCSCSVAILCGDEEDVKKQGRAEHKKIFLWYKKYKNFLLTEHRAKTISLSPFWKLFTVMRRKRGGTGGRVINDVQSLAQRPLQ